MGLFDDFGDDGEIFDSPQELTWEEFQKDKDSQRNLIKKAKRADARYAVPVVETTEEILAARKVYEDDWVLAHKDMFPNSTGLRPFGADQIDSIKKSHHVVNNGGRLAMAEPRGFAKTARTTAHALLGVLQGKIRYALILAASIEKGNEILDSIKAELISNQKLEQLYPAVTACFEHLDGKPQLAQKQTYRGKHTDIRILADRIKFPTIDGEPSSGAIIHVRAKDRVRGLFTKIKRGANAGTIQRPDFVFFDDIQTDDDAENPRTVEKIIRRIKKGVLYGGSHSKKINCIMCCTPIVHGDVSTHFLLNEHGWEVVLYKMMKQPPKRIDMWLKDYAKILLDYDKESLGEMLDAKIRAKQYVLDHYDAMHEGAEMSWEWAYGWDENPQTEVSALQHAMNFLIIEGQESFESECQCNVLPKNKEAEDICASETAIVSKVHQQHRYTLPQETRHMAVHIDVNLDVFTYAAAASGPEFRPHIVDYGTFPEQPGSRWVKGKIARRIRDLYPDIIEDHLRLYQGLKDAIHYIMNKDYRREDGVHWTPNLILVDVSYEYEEMLRAIKDCGFSSSIVRGAKGYGFNEKSWSLEEKKFAPTTIKTKHCFTVPTETNQMVTYMDVNTLKTIIHRGFRTRYGLPGSISLFQENEAGQHMLFAQHINAEVPRKKYNEKEDREIVVWEEIPRADNEHFDNAVGACAGLFYLGCELGKKQKAVLDMQAFMNSQVSQDN